MQMKIPSIAFTNNSQSKKQNSSQTTPSIFSEHDNPIPNKTLKRSAVRHNYKSVLELGAALIDRPFGMALQPLGTLGPVLMKINTCEQHWIRHDKQ